jgi:hypothetical protein
LANHDALLEGEEMTDTLNDKLAAYGMRLEFWAVADLLALSKKTKNPMKHFNKDIAALSAAFDDVGFKGAVYIDKNATKIPMGNGRILAAERSGLKELPVFRILDLSAAKLKKLAIGDNRLRSDKWDEGILINDLKEIVDAGEKIDYLDYARYSEQLKTDMAAEEMQLVQSMAIAQGGEDLAEPYRAPGGPVGGMAPDASIGAPAFKFQEGAPVAVEMEPLPDVDFPFEPTWEIPWLSMKYMQRDGVPTPFVKWGEITRAAKNVGCWHCYVMDEKFDPTLWNDVRNGLRSSATCFVECNFSTCEATPLIVGVYDIFRKRRISRLMQSRAMNIIVDTNVHPKFYKYALLGVPDGWTAFASRGLSGYIERLDDRFAMCVERAQTDDILFVVYGGGKDVAKKCADHGWHWFPERMAEVSGTAENKSGLGLKVDPSVYKDLS